jgi:Flp pilus assembly pilin Flp
MHSGNATVEYGLVIVLVAMSLYGLSTLGTSISDNLGIVLKSNGTLNVPLLWKRVGEANPLEKIW